MCAWMCIPHCDMLTMEPRCRAEFALSAFCSKTKSTKNIFVRKTNTIWYHLHVEPKMWHKWTYLQNINRLTDIENRLVVARGKGGGGGGIGSLGISRCKLVYIEWINNKVLLQSTGNSIQYPVIKNNGKQYEKECIYVYNWVTLLCRRN